MLDIYLDITSYTRSTVCFLQALASRSPHSSNVARCCEGRRSSADFSAWIQSKYINYIPLLCLELRKDMAWHGKGASCCMFIRIIPHQTSQAACPVRWRWHRTALAMVKTGDSRSDSRSSQTWQNLIWEIALISFDSPKSNWNHWINRSNDFSWGILTNPNTVSALGVKVLPSHTI